ncbi:MAG TPA: preprotein translocase subunit YajC [Gammaproteobacteria bacterium]|nr:preprotein translocase subunit YajC [Gammaproteobacteria bacterium]
MKDLKQRISLFSLLLILIMPEAFAEAVAASTAANAGTGGGMGMANGILMAVSLIVCYLLFIRPQNKRAKEHQKLVTGLQKDDEVVTTGGLLGKITKLSDNFFVMMIAEGIEVPVQRSAIAMSVPKGTIKSLA